MVELKKVVDYLDNLFKPKTYSDILMDGLVVEGRKSVRKVGFCVDASMKSFQLAKSNHCQLIIVHHGFITKDKPLKGILKKRMGFLLDNKMSLYVLHFPLDSNKSINNNKELAKLFKAAPSKPLMTYEGHEYGIIAKLKNEIKREDFLLQVEQKLDAPCHLLAFGRRKIQNIAFSSGSSPKDLTEFEDLDIDLLLTGEPKHSNHHDALEMKLNVLYAGHYASEKHGLKALKKRLELKFKDIKTLFFEVPTAV